MRKFIKSFIVLFVFFYTVSLFIYLLSGFIRYIKIGAWGVSQDIIVRIFPHAIIYCFGYIILIKLCEFLGLTVRNKKE